MARKYRKVEQAVDRLRLAAGALAAVTPRDSESAYVAIGALKVWVMDALELLQAGAAVEASTAFVDGYDTVADLTQALPFPEA